MSWLSEGPRSHRLRTIDPGILLRAGTNSQLLDGGAVMATSAGPPGGGGEAYPVAPVALPPAKLRPGRAWYWVALAVFLAGVAWGVVAFVVIIGRVDSFQRVPFPGTGVISLARGGYVVYYEGPGASNGDVPAGHIDVTSL